MELVSKSESIPTNLRLLSILEDVARVGTPVTPSDVNERLKLPKPTIHRLFTTLESEGYLQREPDGRSYTVGRRLRRMSTNTLSSLWVRTARTAVLGRLAEEIGETCNIAIPDRDCMTYLDRVETQWPLRIQLPVGTKVPMYCTASGKMYLSTLRGANLERYLSNVSLDAKTPTTLTTSDALRDELKRTKARGYAQDAEEFMQGMVALAVPINDEQGRLLSTLSFHAPTQRLNMEQAAKHLDRLREASLELSRLLVEEA